MLSWKRKSDVGEEKKQDIRKSTPKPITTPTASPIATPTLKKNMNIKTTSTIESQAKPKISAKSVELQRAKTADPKKVANKSFVATIRTKKNKYTLMKCVDLKYLFLNN